MIGNFGNFNGFIRIGEVDVFSGVLCAIESTIFLIVIIIHAFACYKAQTWEEGPAKLLVILLLHQTNLCLKFPNLEKNMQFLI